MIELVREFSSKPEMIEEVSWYFISQNGKYRVLRARKNKTKYPSEAAFYEISFMDSQILEDCGTKDLFAFGSIVLVETLHGDFYEAHSEIQKPMYRGHGYGVGLYAAAIELGRREGFRVFSSPNPSVDAKRVWKSSRLNSKYSIKKKDDRWVVGT
jgi:GNAT superfamily N-acetyltransferase